MADTGHALPVYRSWPERPYQVIGSLRLGDPNAYWNDKIISGAARQAKARGGDAIVIRKGSEFGVNEIIGAENSNTIYYSSQTTALVIQWLAEKKVQEVREIKDELAKAFYHRHQNVRQNMNVNEMAFRFLFQQGKGPEEPGFKNRYRNTVASLVDGSGGDLFGTWIFKAALSARALASRDSAGFLGLADIRQSGQKITIVSKEGLQELNFNGTKEEGGLQGQNGVGQHRASATGAALPEKISLNFSSRTPNGLISGNVIFQRLITKDQGE